MWITRLEQSSYERVNIPCKVEPDLGVEAQGRGRSQADGCVSECLERSGRAMDSPLRGVAALLDRMAPLDQSCLLPCVYFLTPSNQPDDRAPFRDSHGEFDKEFGLGVTVIDFVLRGKPFAVPGTLRLIEYENLLGRH